MKVIAADQAKPAAARRFRPLQLELAGAAALLLAIWAVQLAAVFRTGAVGQDFKVHHQNMLLAAGNPIGYLFGSYSRTNPPLFYLIGAAFYRLLGPDRWIYGIGFFNSLQNVAALALFYRLALWLIPGPVIRLAALAFIGFLPAFQVASVVFAADAVCQLPFFGALTALTGCLLGRIAPGKAIAIFTGCICLCVSLKYTAVSLVPAGLAALWLLFRCRRLPWSAGRMLVMLGFALMTTGLGAYWILQQKTNVSIHFDPNVSQEIKTPNQMNLRSLVFFRPGDAFLLTGPCYWDMALADPNSPISLRHGNHFSYPGLLCLATFTDAMHIFQPKPKGTDFGQMPAWKQPVTRFACDLGFVWFTLGIVLVGVASVRAALAAWRNRDPVETAVLCVLLFAFAWHVIILGLLPTVTMATAFGYWLPRLIVPALMGYVLVAFRPLGLIGKRSVAALVLLAVACQSLLHVLILA